MKANLVSNSNYLGLNTNGQLTLSNSEMNSVASESINRIRTTFDKGRMPKMFSRNTSGKDIYSGNISSRNISSRGISSSKVCSIVGIAAAVAFVVSFILYIVPAIVASGVVALSAVALAD